MRQLSFGFPEFAFQANDIATKYQQPERDPEDVFHAYLVKGAAFDGKWDVPIIPGSTAVPEFLIPFSETNRGRCSYIERPWVHFFEGDRRIERLWNRPNTYLPLLKKYAGAISPDFSLHKDMPLALQAYNTYRGKALGYWLTANEIPVIPNIRWGDKNSYEFCFSGVLPGSIVAIGSHGTLKKKNEKFLFLNGFDEMLKRLKPGKVLVYGRTPDDIRRRCEEIGAPVIQFNSWFHEIHRR